MRFAGLLFISIVVVACGARTELPKTRPHSPLCGNGVVDPGEACDQGSANSDTPAFTVTQGDATFQVRPIARDRSAASFYDLIGFSSHSGLEVKDESRIYLYVDATTHALSLVINHNIVKKGTGTARMHVSGLPLGFSVDVSDDAGELVATDATTADGKWHWTGNTDGGVIGGLCGEAWSIVATPTFVEGISTWVWVDGDESRKPLDPSQPVTIAPLATQCHTDCTSETLCGG